MARDWLMKSEPEVYGIDDLARDGQTSWEGIRNYMARNYMRDDMQPGDRVLFYHSQSTPPGVAGVAEVCRIGIPDPLQFDPSSHYFDPKSTPEAPRWVMVDVSFVERFNEVVPLAEIKADPTLEGILVARKGQRLSIMPVEPAHFDRVIALGRAKAT